MNLTFNITFLSHIILHFITYEITFENVTFFSHFLRFSATQTSSDSVSSSTEFLLFSFLFSLKKRQNLFFKKIERERERFRAQSTSTRTFSNGRLRRERPFIKQWRFLLQFVTFIQFFFRFRKKTFIFIF